MNHNRGSFWKKCDFHLHTPYSALEHHFGNDFDVYVQTIFKKAIEKQISVIGITDYFTIAGYKKIKTEYLEDEQKMKSLFSGDEIEKIKDILVIPNIEFRLNKIVQIIKIKDGKKHIENGRINFHVFFSDKVPIKLIEESFLHDLDFVYEAEPNERDKRKKLKEDNLIDLGNRLKAEQPDFEGTPLQIGMRTAVVNDEQIIELLAGNNDFKHKYFIAVPADEDLSEISWKSQDHLTRKILISRSNALLSSNPNTIQFGVAEKAGAFARAPIGGLRVYVNYNHLDEMISGRDLATMSHELGHTAGLIHPEDALTSNKWDAGKQELSLFDQDNKKNVMWTYNSLKGWHVAMNAAVGLIIVKEN